MSVESTFLEYSADTMIQYADRIDVCLSKLSHEQLWLRGGENENAVGNLVLHLAGNVRQWIIASLGNQPFQRDRDSEFSARGGPAAAELSVKLRETVVEANRIISGLTARQLTAMHKVQVYEVSGMEAVYHVVEHFSHHAGQIIFATKLFTGDDLGFYRHLSNPQPANPVP
jgi:uncharacterized damage-inducible protein DinB